MKSMLAVTFAGLLLPAYCHAAPLIIADQGKSTFSIVVPQNAPPSVQQSAKELQKDIELSTGATLPLLQDDTSAKGPSSVSARPNSHRPRE